MKTKHYACSLKVEKAYFVLKVAASFRLRRRGRLCRTRHDKLKTPKPSVSRCRDQPTRSHDRPFPLGNLCQESIRSAPILVPLPASISECARPLSQRWLLRGPLTTLRQGGAAAQPHAFRSNRVNLPMRREGRGWPLWTQAHKRRPLRFSAAPCAPVSV